MGDFDPNPNNPKLNELIENHELSQPVFTCLKLTIKTLEQGVKYVQS